MKIQTTHPRPQGGRAGKPVLAVVGATGAVGTVLLGLLTERADVWGEIRLIASPRFSGRVRDVRGEGTAVRALNEEALKGADVAVFAVPEQVAARWVPVAADLGAVVVDGSRAFRMAEDVPLVVPELNGEAVGRRPRGVIASPGCTTLSMIVALGALHGEWGLLDLVLSSYEAVSGAGRSGVEALRGELAAVTSAEAAGAELGRHPGDVRRVVAEGRGAAVASGAASPGDPYGTPVALNVVPFTGEMDEGGWTSEELTVRAETRKLLGLPGLPVAATCVRVPVFTAHSTSLHARFKREVSVRRAREILANAPGVVLCDDPAQGDFPTPADVAGTDPTWAGRVRRSLDDPHSLELFVCADNLRKGAALNMVQIAELVAAERNAGGGPRER
ncbi:aspartate-semialdehyde dehydrogenase [Streptomyces sp. WMMB 322]|uniref:aspartate-semialdehyde dehydrogenase n=1 Tax=Streptomyces sp. WMMB 322 TaxID=1286821 RepID=UPI0006E1B2D0|nr:aspartate-semialdehyde dehydrogenase [Streptomyces sp. WMMB 322]SCK46910.1 aspartate semialdehyde dehydrogenase [Streptomyces sp. WMMB 322]